MREMECSLESLLKRKCEIGNEEDYMHVILTDEEQILDAIGNVRFIRMLCKSALKTVVI